MNVTRILYRGSLSSCNYGCGYCPFAKTTNTREELDRDRDQLNQFVDWVEANRQPIGVFFTPWGEAIIHRYYREAMVRLSRFEHIHRVAVQTNLSGHLDDLAAARTDRLAVWATFHPGETDVPRFLKRCDCLRELKIQFSVGVVGFHEHFKIIAELRGLLHDEVYLWINAPKSSGIDYSETDMQFLTSIDPYFRWNTERWPSRGKPCQTGLTSFTVDGEGDVRRCHFVDGIIGNIYSDEVWKHLYRRACPNATCGCHIGYVHRDDFQLEQLYGENLLERIPVAWPSVSSMQVNKPLQLAMGNRETDCSSNARANGK